MVVVVYLVCYMGEKYNKILNLTEFMTSANCCGMAGAKIILY
jgi:hypothetical protein